MCGRFTQQRPTSEIAAIFEAEDLFDDPGGRFNVAPTDEAAVVVQRDERRAVVGVSLGPDPGLVGRPADRVAHVQRPGRDRRHLALFRDAFRRRRCLVPVDGFYEWLREGSTRQPMRIHDPEERPLALAGLWTGRQDPESGDWHRTFTIVTTTPNDVHGVHPRPDAGRGAAGRLGRAGCDPTTDLGELRALLEPSRRVALDAYPVPPLVNNVRNNGPELVEPAPASTGAAHAALSPDPRDPDGSLLDEADGRSIFASTPGLAQDVRSSRRSR